MLITPVNGPNLLLTYTAYNVYFMSVATAYFTTAFNCVTLLLMLNVLHLTCGHAHVTITPGNNYITRTLIALHNLFAVFIAYILLRKVFIASFYKFFFFFLHCDF